MARQWGFWTKGKLDILRDYLDAFTTASKSSREILYFDLFAGEPVNVNRIMQEPIESSPWVALGTKSAPFSRLRFFELSYAKTLEDALQADFPQRDLKVYSGDCNETIHAALDELAPLSWAPAFAFIDPNGPDVAWTTLEALASFKAGRRYKVELWMLLPVPMFVRFLRVDGAEVRPQDERRITSLYGTDQWKTIYEARVNDELQPASATDEYVNLMRWRLENTLGYKRVHTFEVRNEQGQPIYFLLFATDHEAGDRIMSHLYRRAFVDFPKMREDAIDERKGAQRLFDVVEFTEEAVKYEYEEPWLPYGPT